MTRTSQSIFTPRSSSSRDQGLVPEARPADALPQPGHVHRRDRQRHHDGDLLPRPLLVGGERAPLVYRHDLLLALAHGAVRELRRGDRRGPRARRRRTRFAPRARRRRRTGARTPVWWRKYRRPSSGAVTSSSSRRARSSPRTARSSRASARWTSRRSRASPLRSSVRQAATAPRSRAERACSRTNS